MKLKYIKTLIKEKKKRNQKNDQIEKHYVWKIRIEDK